MLSRARSGSPRPSGSTCSGWRVRARRRRPGRPAKSARVLRHLLRRAGSAAEQLAERGDLAMQAGAGHGVG